MSSKVFIVGTGSEATETLHRHVSEKYGCDVAIVTVDQFNDIKQSVTHIVGGVIDIKPAYTILESPKIPIDKKRKGWQRPYKYHK